jgi:hypothetical protein
MKYDNDFLATLYGNNDLESFLALVEPEKIVDLRTRAIIFTLKESMQSLKLQFSSLQLNEIATPVQKSKAPQET